MPSFWTYIANKSYSVGCTGQTVHLYDRDGNELKKFKDIIYAYDAAFSPDGKIFVVKSTDGRLAVYSLETASLIRKFRFSKINCAQDDGFCFSPDGKYFINIERQQDVLLSAISFYNTNDFSLAHRMSMDASIMLDCIEYDQASAAYYVLGYKRYPDRNVGFVATLKDFSLQDPIRLSDAEYAFYHGYKNLELRGFTEKAYAWSHEIDLPLEKLRLSGHSLAKIYAYYHR